MVSKRETWKRFIRTVLNQSPKYFNKYPAKEQELLNKFFIVLQDYDAGTSIARKKFLESCEKFKRECIYPGPSEYTEEYLNFPFLWFAESYFDRALELLDIAQFHADEFYEYLAKHLRGSEGLFQLVSKGTPLNDITWEKLQYESIKLTVPLTLEEIHVLEAINTYVKELGLSATYPRSLRATITKELKTPKISRRIPQLLKRVHAWWGLSWYYPGFDLARVYFNFQLSQSATFEEIIDYKDPENTILQYSDVYWARNYKNLFMGNLIVPRHLVGSLRNYLEDCHNQEKLILHDCYQVTLDHVSSSLNYYEPGKGWHEWTLTEYDQLVKQLKSKKSRKRSEKAITSLHMTSFNDEWHYLDTQNSNQMIALFCNEILHPFLTFNELPFEISKMERDMLKELHDVEKAVNVTFLPHNMVREYSMDVYWITLPKIPFKKLRLLLNCVPYTVIYGNESRYHIWAYLTPMLARWLQRELKWLIMNISLYYFRSSPKVEDYDYNKRQWKTPVVLEEYVE